MSFTAFQVTRIIHICTSTGIEEPNSKPANQRPYSCMCSTKYVCDFIFSCKFKSPNVPKVTCKQNRR
jgi:hypothetical protein